MNGYLYETHMHTREGSLCASSTGREQAIRYKDLGYSGIIITDHFLGGNTAVDRYQDWNTIIDQYCRGFENAKNTGDRIGIDVWFGIENGFQGTEFLLFGLDKDWLKHHPNMRHWTVEQQYREVSQAGGLVVHAHPMREASYIGEIRLYPYSIDAVEVYNLGNLDRNPLFNDRALTYAHTHKFPITGGSDAHDVRDRHGGMLFEKKLSSMEDFIAQVKTGQGYSALSSPI